MSEWEDGWLDNLCWWKKNALCPNFPGYSGRLLTTRLPFVAVIKRNARWHRITKSPHLLEPLGETLQTGSAPNLDKSASVNLSSHYTHLICLLSTYYIPSHHGDHEGIKSPLPKGAEGEVKHAVTPPPHTEVSPRQDAVSTEMRLSGQNILCNLVPSAVCCLLPPLTSCCNSFFWFLGYVMFFPATNLE